jgi:hypothetical protein
MNSAEKMKIEEIACVQINTHCQINKRGAPVTIMA